MKKVVALIFICCLAFALCACSGGERPAKAWADSETLEYKIEKNGAELGTMTSVMQRNPSDKTINDREYSSADGRMTLTINTADYTIRTEMLMNMYTVLAAERTYTDLQNPENSYVLESRHDGKYYYYSRNGEEESRIKVGKSSYTDGDFIYQYIRCYPLGSTPASLKIGDPETGRAISVTTTSAGTENITVPFPDGSKAIDCTVVAVSLSDAPKGKAIRVAYTPDNESYYVSGLSIADSRKLPVKIVENDVTYTLTSVLVA